MEYTSFKSIKYYPECAPVVEGLGFRLVELKVIPGKEVTKIGAVITSVDPAANISVNDCAKVHMVLLPRLEALIGTDNTTMELTSPGIEHNIKNAAEFELFVGREVRVYDKTVTDWVEGKILSADEKQVTLEKEDGSSNSVLFENIAKAKFLQK
ncbi:MAG: ribosome maturation factor [Treponema sp.]|nr:ribosome maturation factor [Treponema sp.]